MIVPSYNSGAYLREALLSAVAQMPPPYEVIVQDGGSTDASVEILRQFGEAVDWRSEPDGGQADALNKALERTTGDVVVWLNADDVLVPGAFAAASDVFKEHPDTDFVYGDFDIMRADGSIIRRHRSSPYDPQRVLVHGCYIFSGAIFYKRALLEKVGPFDVRLQTCMDLDYLLRLGPVQSIHLGMTVARFRMADTAKSSTMRYRFLRESHAIRWRAAGRSPRLRMLTLMADAKMALGLLSQPLRLTRAWSAVRRGKRL